MVFDEIVEALGHVGRPYQQFRELTDVLRLDASGHQPIIRCVGVGDVAARISGRHGMARNADRPFTWRIWSWMISDRTD